MLTLRLARTGTKKKPAYHLVATDSRSSRDGRFVEKLGYYVPHQKMLVVEHARIEHWLSVGAQMSPTAKRLIKAHKQGEWTGSKELEVRADKVARALGRKKGKGGGDQQQSDQQEQPAQEEAPQAEA